MTDETRGCNYVRIRLPNPKRAPCLTCNFSRVAYDLGLIDPPMKLSLTDALCTRCGFCCDGTLFADVELASKNETSALEGLGLDVEHGEKIFAGCCYSRPSHFRVFVQRNRYLRPKRQMSVRASIFAVSCCWEIVDVGGVRPRFRIL
jgi:hypothetical protein